MKVVVATPMYPPELGEPAAYVQRLAVELSAEHDVTVVALAATFEPIEGVRLVTVSKMLPLPIRTLAFTWQLLGATRGAELIYAQRALAAGAPSTIVGWLRRVPVAVNFVGDEVGDGRKFRIWLQGFVLRAASRVVVPSNYLADRCRQVYGVAPERVVVCPPPLAPDQILPFQPNRDPQLTLVLPHRTSAAAAAAIAGLPGGSRLAVVGDYADRSQLEREASGKDVEFLGHVSAAEIWFRLRQAGRCVVDLGDEMGEAAARSAEAAGCSVAPISGGASVSPAPTWAGYGRALVSEMLWTR